MGRLSPPDPPGLKPGDDCLSCADHWDNQEKARKTLVKLGYSQNKKLTVLACPYCDGERAIDLAKTKK
jgi:uncharacterized protein (DUF2237 family)